MRSWISSLAFVLVVVACSSSNDKVCAPGQQVACACAGGSQGAQVCKSDGSGFGACDCGDASTDAGSTDANASDASDANTVGDAKDAAGCVYNNDPNDTLDHDADGYSVAAGDCDDCDPSVYPGHGC